MKDEGPAIPQGLHRETRELSTSSNTGFVDTAKLPIARKFFFFFHLYEANAK